MTNIQPSICGYVYNISRVRLYQKRKALIHDDRIETGSFEMYQHIVEISSSP